MFRIAKGSHTSLIVCAMQSADAWRNEKLCGRAFSFGPDFVLPDAGRLELDFIEMTDGDGEQVSFFV
jgi:hypothetical protein